MPSVRARVSPCSLCNGHGFMWCARCGRTHAPCSRCGGSGLVPDLERRLRADVLRVLVAMFYEGPPIFFEGPHYVWRVNPSDCRAAL